LLPFNVFVVLALALDLGVFHRKPRRMKVSEAMAWSLLWIALAAGFALCLYFWYGHRAALEFATGYLIELSLSVDNLFVFLLIFRHFAVPDEFQHKVLIWGVAGAVVTRSIFILAGLQLLRRFDWIAYIFGALLVYSGIKLMGEASSTVELPGKSVVRWFSRVLPVSEQYEGGKFLVRRGRLYATPLLLALLVIEATDVLFAADSIPAVLAISLDVVVVYTSNLFAILGLRTLYFALAAVIERFEYLHYGLSLVLIFVGAKMLASHYYEVATIWSLSLVLAIVLLAVVASVLFPRKKRPRKPA
jgi:tellurite resistance protein TerC